MISICCYTFNIHLAPILYDLTSIYPVLLKLLSFPLGDLWFILDFDAVGTIEPSSYTMSAANVNDAPTAERATWDKFTEFDLLDKYLTARNDPKNATEKGLTKSAWSELIKALNEKKNRQLSVRNKPCLLYCPTRTGD